MKRISVSIFVILILALLVYAQSQIPSGTIKRVDVTAQTIASQPAGKPFVLDLTNRGTIYTLAAGIDHSRLRVRLAGSEVAVSDTVKKIGSSSSKLFLGTLDDMSGQNFFFPKVGGSQPAAAAAQYTCSSGACQCEGFSDCLRLRLDKLCKDYILCSGHLCLCPKK